MLSWFFKKQDSASNSKRAIVEKESFRYCPKCGDEYRAEFTTCVSCNVELITDYARKNEDSEKIINPKDLIISPTDKLINIEQGSLAEIKRHKVLLERAGIPSVIFSESGGGKG